MSTVSYHYAGLSVHSHVQIIGKKGQGEGQLKFPIGVTVNRATQDIIVCGQGNDTVKLFDWNSQHKLTLGQGKVCARISQQPILIVKCGLLVKDTLVPVGISDYETIPVLFLSLCLKSPMWLINNNDTF